MQRIKGAFWVHMMMHINTSQGVFLERSHTPVDDITGEH